MSFISDIVQKILHPHQAQAQTQAQSQQSSQTGQVPSSLSSSTVDVEKVLSEMAAKHSQQNLNWRTSIVDLLKVLDLDSSLTARQQLAKELSYNGDTKDSAKMNIWLHEKVMDKIAENGGQVPADLRKH